MACIPGRRFYPAGITAGDLDFSRIHERIERVRVGDKHEVSDGYKINRTPHTPPASGPFTNAPLGHAPCRKGAQDVQGAIDPKSGPAIDRVGQNGNGHIAGGDDAGPRGIALESPSMAEPIPAAGVAAHDSKTVISFEACVRIAPMFPDH